MQQLNSSGKHPTYKQDIHLLFQGHQVHRQDINLLTSDFQHHTQIL